MKMEPIIVASISLVASVVTASLSYYLTKRQQIKSEERKLKEEYYRLFIKAMSDVAVNNNDQDAQKKLSEGFNSLIVIGSPEAVFELMRFHNYIRAENKKVSRDTPEWIAMHDSLLRDLVKAMRRDIFGKEKDIDKFLLDVHLTGRGK